uniref:Uncharacterized protein n=1 Tax=Varanus komodoensis TaxID=61221 RepID=A0A8D2LTK9_VARKO
MWRNASRLPQRGFSGGADTASLQSCWEPESSQGWHRSCGPWPALAPLPAAWLAHPSRSPPPPTSRARSDAPFVPRVLLLGPPGSGKSLGFPVSDSIVLRVLKERLAREDCLTHGWVLHGFPLDMDQADILRHTGYEPNRVFFLSVPTDVAMGRVCQRATDPVSGERYHAVFRPPTDEAVHQRLRRNPRDAPQCVEGKADFYGRQLAELEEYYSDAICLNADQDPYTIFEYIESCLVKPLPVTSR